VSHSPSRLCFGGQIQKTALTFAKSVEAAEASIHVEALHLHVENYLIDCEIEGHSERTVEVCRLITGKLLWWLNREERAVCGLAELRQFFVYLHRAHKGPAGRWDNPHLKRPLRPAAMRNYHKHLRVLFGW
jgi:hypothetical protein